MIVRCPDPGQVVNGQRQGRVPAEGYTVGTTVEYECNECFEGGGDMTCLATGRWTKKPECEGKDALWCYLAIAYKFFFNPNLLSHYVYLDKIFFVKLHLLSLLLASTDQPTKSFLNL